jgi:DNA-binding PadR family transcriptional regulator
MTANKPRDPDDLLPLKPVESLILMMLAPGERHGYGVRQDILDHTEGRVELEAGNLYRYIRQLETEDLIEPSSRRLAAADDPRRQYYRLTPFGRRVLAAEMYRMRALVRLAESHRVITPARA